MTAGPTRGLSLYPTRPVADLRRLAHRAEELGYDALWFGDSQNIWREAYVAMAAAAVGTERIRFGTGVTNGVTRHRSVIASAWASLHELVDGRVVAGFGVGDSALHTMGLEPMRVVELEALLADLRSLWAGRPVGVTPEAGEAGAFRLGWVEEPITVPAYVAASGPRLLDLAGRVADGVILLVGTDPVVVGRAVASVRAAAAAAGRPPTSVEVVLWAPVALDADPDIARDRVRPHVARTVLRPIALDLTADEAAAIEAVRSSYDYYAHMAPGAAHAARVPDSLVDRLALAGTPDEVAARLAALGAAGVDQVAMVPFAADPDAPDDLVDAFAAL